MDEERSSPSNQTRAEDENQNLLVDFLIQLPLSERLRNIGLILRQKDLAHLLFMAEIYELILDIPGYIAEFGVMYGRNMNLFTCLRECFEPYNHTRKIVGFDTFEGFVGLSDEDFGEAQKERFHELGSYSVTGDYEERLRDLLLSQESISHLSHLNRSSVVKGDVNVTLPQFIEDNPETLFSLCYLDLDLYEPTRAVLRAVRPRMVKGAILVFDEVLNPTYPGETKALLEEFSLSQIPLRRTKLSGWKTFMVVE